MEPTEVFRELKRGHLVELSEADWKRMKPQVGVKESHETGQAGRLLVVEASGVLAAVEIPSPGKRVLRPLADDSAVRAFVAERLDTYERMWNGCGCRIDYYE
jgi:hypothetical protein